MIECGVFKRTYEEDMAFRHTALARWRIYLLLLAVVVFPFVASEYYVGIANLIGIAIIGALGLNILTGFTGQISVGQGAFLGVGAYTSAILATRIGLPFWLALPGAGLVTALVGSVFGIPSLRLKGLYLVIATLAGQVIIEWTIGHWVDLTGGSQGMTNIPSPAIGPLTFASRTSYYYLTYAIVLAATVFASNLFRSKVGRAFVAVRDRDIAAEAMGVHLFRYKILAFAVSSFYVGVAGSLWAHYLNMISPEHFTIGVSIEYLAMIIIGGLGTVSGSIFGAIFMTLLPVILRELTGPLSAVLPITQVFNALREGIFGIVIIVFLIYEPHGLAKIWRNIKDYFRLWPFSY